MTIASTTPERRARLAAYGRLGGMTFAAQNDTKAFSRTGRLAFRETFQNGHGCKLCPQVDIPSNLEEAERDRRADFLYRVHFTRLAQQRHR